MADVEEISDTRFDDIDLESILARVERRGPLTFTRKRCLYRAPEFVKRLSGEATVDEGETVRFDCKVVAFPKPTVKWYKDEDPITEHSRLSIEANENGEFSLVIENVTKGDEAAYRCKAENPEGSSSSTIYLAVKAKAKSQKKNPPRVSSFPVAFPPIQEYIKEEELEAEVTRRQPESPLTPLYYGVVMKDRAWPEFLGSWAFVNGVNTKDIPYADEDDDEDVFLSEEIPNGNDDTSRDQNSNHSDSDSENDISDLLNQNLIFENKNLTTEHFDKNECFSVNDLFVLKDENANQASISAIMSNDTTALTPCNNEFCETGPTQPCKSINGNSTDLSSSSCEKHSEEREVENKATTISRDSLIINDNATVVENSPEMDLDCEKQFSSSCTRSIDIDDSVQGFAWKELFFVISGYTFLALLLRLPPDTFVFSLLIGQLLFCVCRYLLHDV